MALKSQCLSTRPIRRQCSETYTTKVRRTDSSKSNSLSDRIVHTISKHPGSLGWVCETRDTGPPTVLFLRVGQFRDTNAPCRRTANWRVRFVADSSFSEFLPGLSSLCFHHALGIRRY